MAWRSKDIYILKVARTRTKFWSGHYIQYHCSTRHKIQQWDGDNDRDGRFWVDEGGDLHVWKQRGRKKETICNYLRNGKKEWTYAACLIIELSRASTEFNRCRSRRTRGTFLISGSDQSLNRIRLMSFISWFLSINKCLAEYVQLCTHFLYIQHIV